MYTESVVLSSGIIVNEMNGVCLSADLSMAEEDKSNGNELGPPSRVGLSLAEVDVLPADLALKWRAFESYADHLEKRNSALEAEVANLKVSEERLRAQSAESSHRERIYMRRLAHKDQELHECLAQINELKSAQAPGAVALRSAMLDPAVNLLLVRLRQEVAAHKTRLEETQSELSAWKFTPDSNTGKRLMAKCRLLYQENEELGRVVSSGRLAKLEGDLALQKRLSEEVKKSQSELDEFLQDLDEDVEGMQGTIYFLQQELRKTKEALAERTNAPVSNGQSDQIERTAVERNASEDSDSDAPLAKKGRRGSELSLDYNEDDLGLTNGDAKQEDR